MLSSLWAIHRAATSPTAANTIDKMTARGDRPAFVLRHQKEVGEKEAPAGRRLHRLLVSLAKRWSTIRSYTLAGSSSKAKRCIAAIACAEPASGRAVPLIVTEGNRL